MRSVGWNKIRVKMPHKAIRCGQWIHSKHAWAEWAQQRDIGATGGVFAGPGAGFGYGAKFVADGG